MLSVNYNLGIWNKNIVYEKAFHKKTFPLFRDHRVHCKYSFPAYSPMCFAEGNIYKQQARL
jgi:hypothetical protein